MTQPLRRSGTHRERKKTSMERSAILFDRVANLIDRLQPSFGRGTIFGAILTFIFLSGCGGGVQQDGDQLSGRIQIDGSSTVYPLTEAVAEEFIAEYPRVRVTVGVSGTGGGFSKFVRSETDISNASRPIKSVEVEQAEQNGISYIELPVAYDGLAVVVHPENDWADCLTVDELEEMWRSGSTVDRWDQVRSSFPNREINLYGPGTDSGTYDYFTAAIVGEEGNSRSDFTASEDDNVLVQGVSGDTDALGFFGLAYYENNQSRLKVLGIDDGYPDNGEGCIEPTAQTVNEGSYQPLSRPEFIYVNAGRADDPAIEAFVEFYLEQVGALAEEVGYVPLSEEAYALAAERFRGRVTGSMFAEGGSSVGVRIVDLLKQQRLETDTTAVADSSVTVSR